MGRGALARHPGRRYADQMLTVRPLRGNDQRLDGGAMFGNAPRGLWQRWCPPDERGRIALACRALLVEEPGRRVLLETGVGAFFDPKLKDRFGVEQDQHVLLAALGSLGLSDADIDVVVLSHLHFDHAGGLLSAYVEGQAPRLLFPEARFVVSRGAFERARAPHLRDRASYIEGLDRLLEESGRLELVDASGAEGARAQALGPRYHLEESSGHTPSMLHTTVSGEHGQIFFAADLIPGVPWVHLPITMGYDRFPERLIDEKERFLARFVADGTRVFFTHDASTAWGRVARAADGRYAVEREVDDGVQPLDLDAPSAASHS